MDTENTVRESLSEKERAQARKADAEAERFRAETLKFQAEARSAAAYAETAELDLADKRREHAEKLTDDKFYHIYQFHESVAAHSVNKCMDQLTEWVRLAPEGDRLTIEIVFHSPGGEIINGMALFDFIRMLRAEGHTVNTMALGMAASMAGILLQAGSRRIMGREAWVLIHEAQFGAIGTTGQVEDTVEWVKMMHKRILNIFAERSNLTVRQLAKRWKRKDWWLDSSECLKYRLVDEVR